MKKLVVGISLLLPYCFCNYNNEQRADCGPRSLTTLADSIGYCMGYHNAGMVSDFSEDIAFGTILRGFNDELNGKTVRIQPEVAKAIMDAFEQKMAEKREKKEKEHLQLRPMKEKEFLKKNKLQPDVITTTSGLQYTIMKKGDGSKPASSDKVKIKYKGTFVDEEDLSFYSSDHAPTIVQVNKTIQGWSEALKMMTVGSTYKLFLSPELAWGDSGDGFFVDSGRTVIYELTLESIEN